MLAEATRVQQRLSQAIDHDVLLAPLATGGMPPTSALGASADPGADVSPFRRCVKAHQQAMSASIAPLRSRLRAALAGQSAALGRLAALDAVMDEAMAARERHSMDAVPALLERHFLRLRRSAAGPLAEGSASGAVDAGTGPLMPAPWLVGFCQTVQEVLHAELETRWHAVQGLIDTMGNPQ